MPWRRVRLSIRAEAQTVPANHPHRRCRRALTQVEVLVVLGMALLLVIIFVLTLPYMRQRPGSGCQTVCAANLRNIGLGMVTYGSENEEYWPAAAHAPAVEEQTGRVTYAPGKIGTHRGNIDDPMAGETTENDTEMSTTRNLWLLIRTGAESPKAFVCPSSDDVPNADLDPEAFWDFKSYSEVSYGYQVPYGKLGRPSSMCHMEMPLAADKGPYGAVLEAGMADPGVPTPASGATPDAWMPWNSPNHGGEGQNVLFVDCHVDFVLMPIVGVENDNIYTRWSDATGGTEADDTPRTHGTPPTSNETPWSDTDTLIYP